MSETVDLVFTNAHVLTMDENFTQYDPGAVAVRGDEIIAAGPDAEIQQNFDAPQLVDCQGKALLPGLINTHTHAPMTLLRGIADDLRLDVWLLGYLMPVEREFVSPEFVRLGTDLACIEMIRSGTTCFADMYYFEDEVAKAAEYAGLRAVVGQTVLRFPAPDAGSFEEALASAEQLIKKWKGHPLIIPSVAPHAPYTCTDTILRAVADLAIKYDVPLQIHLAETEFEVNASRDEHNMPVIPYVKKQGVLDAKTIAAHCVHLDDGEMNTLEHHGTGVAHNPSSNLKLASGIAPIAKMHEVGVHVGIGTDGPASNNDLDMFEEIRLAALLAKGSSGDPTAIPARTAIAMATCGGAKALHLDHLIGSIEAGKRADMILVDLGCLHNAPRFRRDDDAIYARLVYASKSTDVTDVMVNGNWLMQDRVVHLKNETELLQSADEFARRIDSFLIERERSVASKLVAIGGAAEQESFEVQAKIRVTNIDQLHEALKGSDIEVLHHRHYHEYDTYFSFDELDQGWLRYREDEYLDETEAVNSVRARLTLIGPVQESELPSQVLLSRSRYMAPASHSRRFYREYFKPTGELEIVKDRQRWRVLFRGTELYINLDTIEKPDLGTFLEVKSRTWSRVDAEHKATVASALLGALGGNPDDTVTLDYFQMIN